MEPKTANNTKKSDTPQAVDMPRETEPPVNEAREWRSDWEREAYARFGEAVRKVVVECYLDDRIDEWADDLTELLAKFGLARRVKYDPEQHGYVDCADPGDEIWWLGDWEAEHAPLDALARFLDDRGEDFLSWRDGCIVVETCYDKQFRALGGDTYRLMAFFEDYGNMNEAGRKYIETLKA